MYMDANQPNTIKKAYYSGGIFKSSTYAQVCCLPNPSTSHSIKVFSKMYDVFIYRIESNTSSVIIYINFNALKICYP